MILGNSHWGKRSLNFCKTLLFDRREFLFFKKNAAGKLGGQKFVEVL
jgi:hypothetical protein